jgi:hypothetical protein
MFPRSHRLGVVPLLLTVLAASPHTVLAGSHVPAAGTRASGVRLGPHDVGFDVIRDVDRTRRINARDDGMRVGIALWYPAERLPRPRSAMRSIDYRLLTFDVPLTPPQREALEEEEIEVLRSWLHAGIVPMTREQARLSLHAPGLAVNGAAAKPGRWPVVAVLGGPYYLSTTAEVLASHGFLVIAPFRCSDQPDDVSPPGFTGYLESSVRDAEWALDRLRTDRRADLTRVGVLGHGGGGMQAMLLAMHTRLTKAVVNIDAANFSTRSAPNQIPTYNPRSMRAPYLFIATASTRKALDRFDDFVAMRFSARTEIVLDDDRLRHHDLSDIGRAVTAPLGIRGDAQADVQDTYAFVQAVVVRFFQEQLAKPGSPASPPFADAVESLRGRLSVGVTVRPGTEPAPTTAQVIASVGRDTVTMLAAAQARDPGAPVFEEGSLSRLVARALTNGDVDAAAALARFALVGHPRSAVLLQQAGAVAERQGDRAYALTTAMTCSGLQAENDWRAAAAIRQCQDRVERLEGRPATRTH